jgi:DNA-binding response OmpR family regulator
MRLAGAFIRGSYHHAAPFPARPGKPVPVARVLICESEPDVGALLALQLHRLGHEAVIYNGSWTSPLHVVDVVLIEPGGSGLELAREIRRQAPGLPIVCSSIYPRSPETDALAPAAYLVKPYPSSRLDAAIRAAA